MAIFDYDAKSEALRSTEPGHHAHVIGSLLYDHANAIGEDYAKKLRDISHYLEILAWEQIDYEINKLPKWVKERWEKKCQPGS